MDTTLDLLDYVVPIFEELGIRYAVGGSMASMVYGEPRVTRDLDVVVYLPLEDVPRLLERFPRPDFYADLQTAREAARLHTQFNIIHAPSALKIDVYIAADPITRSQIKNARRLSSPAGTMVNFSPPEELIIKKMEAFAQGDTDRHLRDVAGMLQSGREHIDVQRVADLAEEHGLSHIWTAVRQRVENA